MSRILAEVMGPQGEVLQIRYSFGHSADDPLVKFLHAQMANDAEAWPVSGVHQGWGLLSPDGNELWCLDDRLISPELFVLCLKRQPVACASLICTDMSRNFDPTLPAWVESLTPWRSCVSVESGFEGQEYDITIGTAVLQRAKQHGFTVVFLFVSYPTSGNLPSTWRGFPCEVVWVGDYCLNLPMKDGTMRPRQMVLAIPLENVPDAAWSI